MKCIEIVNLIDKNFYCINCVFILFRLKFMHKKIDKKIGELKQYYIHESVFLIYFIWNDLIQGREIERINYLDFDIQAIYIENHIFLINYFELSLLSNDFIKKINIINYSGSDHKNIACIYLADCVKRLKKIEDKANFFKHVFLDSNSLQDQDLMNAFKMSKISISQYANFLNLPSLSLNISIKNLSRD